MVIVVLGLAGCGKDKTSTSSAASASPTVEAYDFYFSPTTLNVKAGSTVKLTLKNEGQKEHNFSITSASVSTDVANGADATVTFTAPAAGDVQFFCKYHKDSKQMVGTLHVT
jgi:plastocyanin